MSDDLVLVLRPGAMVRPRADGLVVRAVRGEKFVRSALLAERWPALQPALAAGLGELPAALVTALVDAGAAALVSPSTAASTVPWHRYALAWAHDPDAAIVSVSVGCLWVTAGEVEGATVARSAAEWRLDGVAVLPGDGCTVERMAGAERRGEVAHRGTPEYTVVVEPYGHHLMVRLADGADPFARARSLGDGALDQPPFGCDLSAYPAPTRSLAAGTALLAALALGSGGAAGWSRPVLPLVVNGDDLSIRGGDGWSSR